MKKMRYLFESADLLFICKLLLVVHFSIDITSKLNGFNYLVYPVGFLYVIWFVKNIRFFFDCLKRTPYMLFIIFICSYLITFCLYHFHISTSIKTLVWMGIHFFLTFTCECSNKNKDNIKKEIVVLLDVMSFIFAIFHIINTYQLLTHFGGTVISFIGQENLVGLTEWGRFYGVFHDPNCGSAACLVLFIYAFYRFGTVEEKRKIPYCLSGIANLLYIYFSQSRTGLLSLQVIVFTCLITYNLIDKNKNTKKTLILITIAVLICFILPPTVISIYNRLSGVVISRSDITGDISNRRFSIWLSGLEMFLLHPIFGVGAYNSVTVALRELPTTYIVNNDFMIFTVFHNVIVDIAVNQGILGLLIMLLLAVFFIIQTVKYFAEKQEYCNTILFLLVSVFAIFLTAMFLTEILYVNNTNTFLFWLLLGYYSCLLEYEKKGKLEE